MNCFQVSSLRSLSILFLLFKSILTQSNRTDLRFCRHVIGDLDANAQVNSTGSQLFQFSNEFSGDQDWRLSVTLNDTRDPVLVSSMHEIQGYLSVPEDVEAEVCIYMYGGMDHLAGDQMSGCEDIISQECVEYLERNIKFPTIGIRNNDGNRRCNQRPIDDEAREMCGDKLYRGPLIHNCKCIL